MKRYLPACAFTKRRAAALSPALLLAIPLAACSGQPAGPTVAALPGQGQSLQAFQANDAVCRHYAQYRIESQYRQEPEYRVQDVALMNNFAAGAPAGASNAPLVGDTDQQRYDISYAQCMASKGAMINTDVLLSSGYSYYPSGSPTDAWYYPSGYPSDAWSGSGP
jgi:hypothetical protein